MYDVLRYMTHRVIRRGRAGDHQLPGSGDRAGLGGRGQSPVAAMDSPAAMRKLRQLNQAASLAELGVFRGNRLEPLSGDRLGQFSVRVNDQWRICFRWTERGPENVEIVDYHP